MKQIAAGVEPRPGAVSGTPSADGYSLSRGGALRAGDQRVDFLISRADRDAREEASWQQRGRPRSARQRPLSCLSKAQPGARCPLSAKLSQHDQRFACPCFMTDLWRSAERHPGRGERPG
jgi:hypothetical protein